MIRTRVVKLDFSNTDDLFTSDGMLLLLLHLPQLQ